jgi:erythromycin esterase-like protein
MRFNGIRAARAHIIKFCAALFCLAALQSCAKAEPSTIEQVTAALCDKTIVLLGEGGEHGEGTTTIFKGGLIKNLIETCGFNAVLFESNTYEFADIRARRSAGEIITKERLGAAIGGLWANDQQFQPVLETLTKTLNAGRITMGGLDDRLSGRGQTYANDELIPELTANLPAKLRDTCRNSFRKRIYSDFPTEAPYSEQVRSELQTCLASISAAPPMRQGIPLVDFSTADLVASLQRWLSRDFLSWREANAGRDASMYENFAAFQARPPADQKVIIWTATVHAAKSARNIPSFSEGPNLGELLMQGAAREPAQQTPFVLGFSSRAGSIRMPGGKIHELEIAAPDSLEAQAFAGLNRESLFADSQQLKNFGAAEARVLSRKADVRHWHELVDGVVVFRQQTPAIVERP